MRRPPLLSLLGLAIAVAGVALDTVVHLSAGAHHHEVGFSLQEHGAHLVVMIGMVLILAGIVLDGTRRHLSRRALPATTDAHHRSSTHAIR